jgi:hypothetical protein
VADEPHAPRTIIPNPDPSSLTTANLRHELLTLREFLLSNMQRIEEVHTERFKSIDTRFGEGKTALDAALRAQKDTAEKSEASFTKQMDGIQDSIKKSAEATGDRITDLRGRLDRGEGTHAGSASTIVVAVAIGAMLISLAGLAVEISVGSGRGSSVISTPARTP